MVILMRIRYSVHLLVFVVRFVCCSWWLRMSVCALYVFVFVGIFVLSLFISTDMSRNNSILCSIDDIIISRADQRQRLHYNAISDQSIRCRRKCYPLNRSMLASGRREINAAHHFSIAHAMPSRTVPSHSKPIQSNQIVIHELFFLLLFSL